MKAMVLAAGLGTRLRPLTDERPKALVEVAGRTLLEITLTRLREFGVRGAIVNAHHFADQVVDYLQSNRNFGMRIEVSREEVLLDTGGGLKRAASFFLEDAGAREEPFILHNVDVISTIDLARMVKTHAESHALATLAVQKRESSRYLVFNEQFQLCGRRTARGQQPEMLRQTRHPTALAFSGIHVVSTLLLRMMKEEGAFSIIDTYLRLAGEGKKIQAFPAGEYYWRDLGTPESLRRAEEDLKQNVVR
jgi:NDP-sugar pyrophosphorylase family protein